MHFHQIMVGFVVLFQFRFMRGIVGFFLRFEENMGVGAIFFSSLN